MAWSKTNLPRAKMCCVNTALEYLYCFNLEHIMFNTSVNSSIHTTYTVVSYNLKEDEEDCTEILFPV